jgi:alpha-tubulin suppressor-like RCC1 family protein
MPNPNTNFKDSFGTDLGNKLITKEYLMTVYPQIANQLITPELWVWGYSGFGQLGNNNSLVNISTPITTIAGGANWKQVSCGYRHTAAIKTDGTLWTWGFSNSNNKGSVVVVGTLGINDTTTFIRSTPVTTFAGGTNWKQVSCGGNFTAAIKTDGTLWTWGNNSNGQLGDNTGTNRLTPVTTFAGGTNWKQVAGGGYSTAAIKTDGTLWTWGYGAFGQLGDNTTTFIKSTPVTTFAGGTNWKQVSCGQYHTAAIKTDGTLWGWGEPGGGRLGDNTNLTSKLTPVTTFAGGTNWKQVSGGNNHTAAIKTDGTLWTWGSNTSAGVLGINSSNAALNISTPVTTFAGGTNWKQVACVSGTINAIKTDGTLWIWGSNNLGQLGDNTIISRSTPVTTFAGGTNWKQVSAGPNYTAAIKTSDDLQGI